MRILKTDVQPTGMRTRGIGLIHKTGNPGTTLQSVRCLCCYFINEDRGEMTIQNFFPPRRRAPTYHLTKFSPKSAWKWKNWTERRGACVPNAPLGSDNVSVSDPGFPYFMVFHGLVSSCKSGKWPTLKLQKCVVLGFACIISFLKKKRGNSPKFLNVKRERTIMLTGQFANQPPILLIQTAVFVLVIKNFDSLPKT